MKHGLKLSLSSVLLAGLLLSGCGGNNGNTAGGPDNAPQQGAEASGGSKTVTLKWWGGVPEENGPKAVVDRWNAENTDIKVEYVRFVNDDPGNVKLETALLSNTDAPDLFVNYADAHLERRIKAGMVEPLEGLIESSGFDLEGIIGSENITKVDGKIYNLPGSRDVKFVAFNKASLDAIGESVPEPGWTWDEYAALAEKLTKEGQYGAFFNPTWEPIAFDVLNSAQPKDAYYAADGSSNFGHEAFRKGLELQKKLIDGKHVMPYAEGVANKAQPQDELLNGRTASTYSSAYFVRYIKDDTAYPNRDYQIAFAPMPQWTAGGNINNTKLNDMTSINAKSPNKEAAMKFLSWYLTEGNTEMLPGGRIPSSKKADVAQVAEAVMGDKAQYFDKDSFVKLLNTQYTNTEITQTAGLTEMRKAFMEEAEKYFMDAQDLDTTVQTIKQRADEAIAAAK